MKKLGRVRITTADEAGAMKLPFKSIGISTILHATESEEKVRETLRFLVPEEVEIEKEDAEGHYGDSIIILSADIENRPHMREFWDNFQERLVEGEKEWLARNGIDRIADDCTLYLRLDKQLAVKEGELRFSDSGDVIHVRINVSAYPAKRELAVENMEKFIEAGLDYD